MKKENIINYYTDEDLINFKKLNNFKEFKSNNTKNHQTTKHEIKYSVSDNNYFNKIMNIENEKKSSSKDFHKLKENAYYNKSDFQKFSRLNQFTNFNNDEDLKGKKKYSKNALNYTSDDMNKFDKIIKIKSENLTNLKSNNKKVKIVDFDKLNKKKIKNKAGIEKIKIVYFD